MHDYSSINTRCASNVVMVSEHSTLLLENKDLVHVYTKRSRSESVHGFPHDGQLLLVHGEARRHHASINLPEREVMVSQ